MKKIIYLFLLFFSAAKCTFINKPQSIESQKICLNTAQPNFGSTHFIIGYKEPDQHQDKTKETLSPLLPSKKRNPVSNTIELLDESRQTQAFFTSIHDVRSIISTIIAKATKCIRIAAFALTDPDIANQLKALHDSGVKIEIITDFANMNEQYSKIKPLVQHDIPVWYYSAALNTNPKQKNSRYARMHHKITVCDDNIVITGSANLTKSGQKDNIENIIVIRDKETVDHYIEEFEHLKKHCVRCQPILALA